MHWDSVETAIRTSFDEEPLTFLKSTLCRQTNQAKSFEFGPTRQEATFTAFFQFGLRPSCLPFLAIDALLPRATFVTFIVLAVNYSFQSRSSLPSRNNQHQTPHILLVPSLVLHPPLIGANIAGQ